MKTLEKLTKKELVKYIIEIRPKADAYDRVCQELGITCNILEHVKKLNKPAVSNNEAGASSDGVAVYCSCKDKYISRIETERVTYCQCGKIIKQ